jgi:hypothetical protein
MVKAAGKGKGAPKKAPAKKISKKNRTTTMAATISEKNKGLKRKPKVTATKTMKAVIAEAPAAVEPPTPAKTDKKSVKKASAKKSSGKKSAGKKSAGKKSAKK